MAKAEMMQKAELYPDPPRPKDYVYDPKFNIRWFQRMSDLWYRRLPRKAIVNQTGEEVTVLSWRRAWFGPVLCLQFQDGRIGHGYDPATVRFT